MTFVVGLTGGIGSGKSTVADGFAALGAAIVDTDAIAHALTAPGGPAIAPIRQAFGDAALTPAGALDRPAMRHRVFADATARARLEAILHPLIRVASDEQLRRAASADFPYVVLVVPLLVESGGYRDRVNRIAVVDCPETLQIERLAARNGMGRDEALAIMAAQATRSERLAIADDVIDNAAGLEALHAAVAALHDRYLDMARKSRRG